MAEREFVFRTTHNNWSKPVGLTRHMSYAKKRVQANEGPFVVTQDGDPISKEIDREPALDRYQEAAKNRELGSVLRIRGKKDIEFTGKSCKEKPDRIDINGNKNADEFWTWVVNTYPTFKPRFAGSYVCKNVAGSSSPSQHSYGNACDIFFGSIAQQEIVFRDVTNRKAPVPVAHAISLGRIWEPGTGIRSYGGIRHYHLHCDFLPQYSGSCGVRG